MIRARSIKGIGVGILSFVLALGVFGVDAEAQPSEKIVWTFATNPGPAANTWAFHPFPRFQKLLEERTGGRLTLQTKVGLFPPNEVIHAVIRGQVEMGFERTPWLAGTFQVWDLSLPFFWDNIFEYESFINDPRMVSIERKTYGEKGLIKIADICIEALDGIFANKALPTLEDFKGLKVRTGGFIPTAALKMMGANPLSMGTTEILEALQRRTVDAIQTNRGWGLGFGLSDVCSHVSIWRVQSVFSGMLIVNEKKFNALPKDLQQIVLDTGREIQGQVIYGAKVEEFESEIGVKVSKLKLVQPDKEEVIKARKLVKPVMQQWIDRSGPYAKEILSIAGEYAGGAKDLLN